MGRFCEKRCLYFECICICIIIFSCFLTPPKSSKSIKYSNRSFYSKTNTIREDVKKYNKYIKKTWKKAIKIFVISMKSLG